MILRVKVNFLFFIIHQKIQFISRHCYVLVKVTFGNDLIDNEVFIFSSVPSLNILYLNVL